MWMVYVSSNQPKNLTKRSGRCVCVSYANTHCTDEYRAHISNVHQRPHFVRLEVRFRNNLHSPHVGGPFLFLQPHHAQASGAELSLAVPHRGKLRGLSQREVGLDGPMGNGMAVESRIELKSVERSNSI